MKEVLNNSLYKIHLQTAPEWGNSWHLIRDCTHGTLNQDFERKYKLLDSKLARLLNTQKQRWTIVRGFIQEWSPRRISL